MIINRENLAAFFQGFKAAFQQGFEGTESKFGGVAMEIPSQTSQESYGWLGQFPRMREWVGDRVINNLRLHDFAIKNRKFEVTISVYRDDLADDRIGIYNPIFQELGRTSQEHPDELGFNLLAAGFSTVGYDGQFFFDTDHPVIQSDGSTASVSNFQGGSGTPWFLLDTSRAMRPMILQRREPASLSSMVDETDENVFMRDEFIYGVRARYNVGFGLWQLAYASKEPLTADNYEAARLAMQQLKGDQGRPLNVRPTTLVCGPTLEADAMRLLNGGSRAVEVTTGVYVALDNEWQGTANVVVSPWLT